MISLCVRVILSHKFCPSIPGLIESIKQGALDIRSLRILSLVGIELALPLPSGNCDEVDRDPCGRDIMLLSAVSRCF